MGFMDFFNKKKQPEQKEQDFDFEGKLFPISKPFGYSPKHVEAAIGKYTEVIEQQKHTINNLKEQLIYVKNEKEKLENEFRAIQMQLNFVSIPSVSDIQENYIKEKFDKKFKQSENRSKSSMIEDEINSDSNMNPFRESNDNAPITENTDNILDELYSDPADMEEKMKEEPKQVKIKKKISLNNIKVGTHQDEPDTIASEESVNEELSKETDDNNESNIDESVGESNIDSVEEVNEDYSDDNEEESAFYDGGENPDQDTLYDEKEATEDENNSSYDHVEVNDLNNQDHYESEDESNEQSYENDSDDSQSSYNESDYESGDTESENDYDESEDCENEESTEESNGNEVSKSDNNSNDLEDFLQSFSF